MLGVGIYVKYYTVKLVPEAAAKDTVNELRPDANAPNESEPSESGEQLMIVRTRAVSMSEITCKLSYFYRIPRAT